MFAILLTVLFVAGTTFAAAFMIGKRTAERNYHRANLARLKRTRLDRLIAADHSARLDREAM